MIAGSSGRWERLERLTEDRRRASGPLERRLSVESSIDTLPVQVPLPRTDLAIPALSGSSALSFRSFQAHVPARAPGVARSAVVTCPSHLFVGLPGEGLGGAAFFLDLEPAGSGTIRNVIWTGSKVLVKFFVAGRWLATAAPNSVVALTGSRDTGRARSPTRIEVVSGALLLESRTLLDREDLAPEDMIFGSDAARLAGLRSFIVAESASTQQDGTAGA